MKTINLDNIEVEDLSSAEDEEEDDEQPEFECNKCSSRVGREKTQQKHTEKMHPRVDCAVCRESFRDVAKLQQHILTVHSNKSEDVTEALERHMQLLNSVLINQETIEVKLNNMYLKQACLAIEMKEVKDIQQSAVMPVESPPPLSTSNDPQQPPTYARMTSTEAPQQALLAPQQLPLAQQQPLLATQGLTLAPHQALRAPLQLPLPPQQPPRAPQGLTLAPQQATCGPKIVWVGDSIAHHVNFEDIEKALKSKMRKKKAYGSVRASGQKFPESNFTEVVPRELRDQSADILVMQASSVDLTNIPADASKEYCEQVALVSSQNMVTVAKNALASNSNIKNVLVFETTPRYDNKHDINVYAQKKLQEAKDEAKDNRIVIGKHSLACSGGHRVSRYGVHGNPRVDGVHLRGSSGMVAYTRSVAKVLAEVGLITEQEAAEMSRNKNIKFVKENGGWNKNKANKGRTPRPAQQISVFELATQNRFGPLQYQQGNC